MKVLKILSSLLIIVGVLILILTFWQPAPRIVVAGQVAGAATGQTSGAGTTGKVVLLPKEEVTTTPTENQQNPPTGGGGELGGGGSTEGEIKGESTPKSKLPFVLGGMGIIIVILAFYFLRKKEA